jgi:hypothetical protein
VFRSRAGLYARPNGIPHFPFRGGDPLRLIPASEVNTDPVLDAV